MKNLRFLYIVPFTVAIALAQITFTREWVAGKRSLPYKNPSLSSSSSFGSFGFIDDELCKVNLMPAIKYLIEVLIDNMKNEKCSPQKHLSFHENGLPFFVNPQESDHPLNWINHGLLNGNTELHDKKEDKEIGHIVYAPEEGSSKEASVTTRK